LLIEKQLTETRGRPSGFDYLRLILALAVVLLHIPTINFGTEYVKEIGTSLFRPIFAIVLPMFFALSGFLVAGSLFRSKSLVEFLSLRVLRIVPALAVEVLLCALILGTLFTTLPLSEYFADPRFHVYFLNIVGDIHYLLPGVFESNPHPATVNEQLWTVPWELRCYIALALLSIFRIARNRYLLLAAVAGFHVLVLIRYIIKLPDPWVSVHGLAMLEAFLVGVVFYAFADKISLRKDLFIVSLIATFVLLSVPYGDYLVSIPSTYATVYLGLLNPPRNRIALSGDYSYGIYLYGFAIQQAIAAAFPSLRGWWIDVVLALPLILAVAAFSWWIIERPTLRLRTYIPPIEAFVRRRAAELLGRASKEPSI